MEDLLQRVIPTETQPTRGLLSALLGTRRAAAIVLLLGLSLLTAEAWRPLGLPCPFAWITGLPCPGCGMTRALLAGLTGHGFRMLQLHAFAPVVLVLVVAFAVAALGPAPARARLLQAVGWCERRRLPTMLVVLAVLYWLARLVSLR